MKQRREFHPKDDARRDDCEPGSRMAGRLQLAPFSGKPDGGGLHREAFAATVPGMAILDGRSRRIVQANPSFAALLGRSVDEVLGLLPSAWSAKPAYSSSEPGTPARPLAPIITAGDFEMQVRDRNGRLKDVRMWIAPFELDGRPFASVTCVEISVRKAVEKSLRESENKLRVLLDVSCDMITVLGADGRIVECNRSGQALAGITRGETTLAAIWDSTWWQGDEERQRIRCAVGEAARGAAGRFELTRSREDGTIEAFDVSVTPIPNGRRLPELLMVEAHDISQIKNAQAVIFRREQEVRSLVDRSPDGMVRYDHDCRRTYMNPAMAHFTGGSIEAFVGRTLDETTTLSDVGAYKSHLLRVFETGESSELEISFRLIDGRTGWAQVRFSPQFDAAGHIEHVLAITRDITELVEKRRQIHEIAYSDPLTGLPNRTSFSERFEAMQADARDQGRTVALLMIDLDHFKHVNDTLGHIAGDKLLCAVAKRLAASLAAGDFLARLGGDEFAVLLHGQITRSQAEATARRLSESFRAPFTIDGHELFASASIGIALLPEDGHDGTALLSRADAAMYDAKRNGRGGFRRYSAALSDEANRRLTLASALHSAVQNGEFELYYQAKKCLFSERLVGAEALLRWNHPELGLLTPDTFIPIAEETGMIVDIGRWVLLTACRATADWNRIAAAPLKVAVNLSGRQFQRNDLLTDVATGLGASGCKPEWLECEITESLTLSNVSGVHHTLRAIRRMGISVAIDDFGKGQSALAYLHQFDVDVLKIDRSFIDGMDQQPRKTELVKAFISMASALGMTTVAEGIETPEQAALLRLAGCGIGQGYLFGRPVPRSAFDRLVEASDEIRGRPTAANM
ncbi:EAL domain-containing protein [Rhizobium sp. TRM95111]|uniref:sensor domain-containing protein n=1 Tax=Rhizobium alarense TaxID=2846851 RepID=UPI001F17786C|nr:bifunctional diguanylate cyclase/phosphodiesterase [Rhizobium alarense]MCF3643132.1 EAL domain-containing protein [Rhizobium alarense]